MIRQIEDWKLKLKLDNGQIVGAVLMDSSKASDCIPHELLIAYSDPIQGLMGILKATWSFG